MIQGLEGGPPREREELRRRVGVCQDRVGLGPSVLAAAARAPFLLSQPPEAPLPEAEIRGMARGFEWTLAEEPIDQVVVVLRELRLVRPRRKGFHSHRFPPWRTAQR